MYTTFRFSLEKDLTLQKERGFSFSDIISSIADGGLIDIHSHDNTEKYPNQLVLSVEMPDGIYRVPAVPERDGAIFLKTAYRSRVATKKFTS